MRGMGATTGKPLEGLDHLIQSIRDILTTPIGTRVMRREYGSRLPELIDAPMTPGLLVEIYAAVAVALDRWEPRFELARVRSRFATPGKLTLDLFGKYEGEDLVLEGVNL